MPWNSQNDPNLCTRRSSDIKNKMDSTDHHRGEPIGPTNDKNLISPPHFAINLSHLIFPFEGSQGVVATKEL